METRGGVVSGVAAAHVRRPDEVLARHVEVPLGVLAVVVGAAGGVQVGHELGDHEDVARVVQAEADELVGARADGPRRAPAAPVLLGQGTRGGVGVGDVADLHVPGRGAVGEQALRRRAVELPDPQHARQPVPVVGGHHVAEAVVGMPARSVLVAQEPLGSRLEVDEAVVGGGMPVRVVLDEEVAAALVELALVELRGDGVIEELLGVFLVGHAAERRPRARLLDGGGVDLVVVAGVRLPDVFARSELRGDVEHGGHRLRDHVEALELGALRAHVELGRLGGAEVPALGRRPVFVVIRGEEGAHLRDLVRDLVVAEQRRSAVVPAQADDDQHGVAADVVVHVAPVRVADVVHAVEPPVQSLALVSRIPSVL